MQDEKTRLVISPQELEAVSALTGPVRYSYCVKRIADWETAWSLWDEGWALCIASDGDAESVPIWPAKEYAEACAVEQWHGCQAKEIPVAALISDFLASLRDEGRTISIFPVPELQGVFPTLEEFEADLLAEMSRYE